jgi:hypothetical protein
LDLSVPPVATPSFRAKSGFVDTINLLKKRVWIDFRISPGAALFAPHQIVGPLGF